MGVLYIEGILEEDEVLVTVEGATCLTLHIFLRSKVQVCLLPPSYSGSPPELVRFSLRPFAPSHRPQLSTLSDGPPPPGSLCLPPVLALDDGISCVAGLAILLRQMCKEESEEGSLGEGLLGFRRSCLAAPSETSPFVWFCEGGAASSGALDRLELHLSLPVRVHNAGKYRTQLSEEGRFVEGPHFLLTDLVLAVAITILLQRSESETLDNYPHISLWYSRVRSEKGLGSILDLMSVSQLGGGGEEGGAEESSAVDSSPPLASLYKRDPTRYKPRHKIYTQQNEIESSLEQISSVKMMDMVRLEFEELPDWIPLPDVPAKRKERKSQQIQSFVAAALKMVKDGDLVVDFCSGSGHVGLALAVALSATSCRLVLLDAKEGSLLRARDKVGQLQLNNVWIVQANLNYFTANFQVGVALHACGVASDLVLHKCLGTGASLVLCPCCYGGIQRNDRVEYPQSEEYRTSGLSQRGYIVLGHCADQAGEQGERGMLAIDTDRCLVCAERGYRVQLTKMEPLTCSTRNNLILAVKE